MNTASRRISHVLVAGLTVGILAGLALPRVDVRGRRRRRRPSSEPVEPSAPTTVPPADEPSPTTDATDVSARPSRPRRRRRPRQRRRRRPPLHDDGPRDVRQRRPRRATTSTTTVPSKHRAGSRPVGAGVGVRDAGQHDGDAAMAAAGVRRRLSHPRLRHRTAARGHRRNGPWSTTASTPAPRRRSPAWRIGTAHYFRIHAVNQDGPGGVSEEITATPRTVPGAPLSMAAAPTTCPARSGSTWTAPA